MLPFTMAKNTGFSRWLCICVYYHYPPCVVLECRVCWCGSVGIMKNINISSGPEPGPGQPAASRHLLTNREENIQTEKVSRVTDRWAHPQKPMKNINF